MKKRKLAAITILAAALCLSGCGGSSSSNGAYYKEQAAGSSYEESYAREDAMMAAEAESADAAAGDYAGDYTADGGETDSALRAQDGQKIVYTGNLRIQTLEYDKSAASIRQKIKEAGGFVVCTGHFTTFSKIFKLGFVIHFIPEILIFTLSFLDETHIFKDQPVVRICA